MGLKPGPVASCDHSCLFSFKFADSFGHVVNPDAFPDETIPKIPSEHNISKEIDLEETSNYIHYVISQDFSLGGELCALIVEPVNARHLATPK